MIRASVYHGERAIQKQIVAALRKAGWLVYILSRSRGARYHKGLPDLFIRHTARKLHGWVEVKRPGEKLRPEQEAFRRAALDAGESHWVVCDLWNLPGLIETAPASYAYHRETGSGSI